MIDEVILPVAEDFERFIIGACLQFENRLREYMGFMQTEHFGLQKHRLIWAAIRRLYEQDDPVNMGTITFELKRTDDLEAAGGIGYLVDAFGGPDVDGQVWAKHVIDAYARRRLMLKCNESILRLSDRNEDPALISQELEEESRNCVSAGQLSSGFVGLADSIRKAGGFDAYLRRDHAGSIPYPWSSLNRMTNGGMKPGQVIVIGGMSGKGKTTLALNIALHAAMSGRGVPLIFSLEMDEKEINQRLLALAARVDSFHFDKPTTEERLRLSEGRRILVENELMIDDSDNVSIPAINAAVSKFKASHEVSLVIVDYIQLVEGRRGGGENREQEISRIMRSMKRSAKKLKLPYVALTQILEDAGAGTREPELKDCRESRSIGHTSNLAGFLHFTTPYDISNGRETGELDFIIRKQRGGPEGRFPLRFHAPTGYFYEPADRFE